MDRIPSSRAKSDCVQPFDFRHGASFIEREGLVFLNSESSGIVETITNDRGQPNLHIRSVEKNWFLKEWLEHCGKRQASLVNELGWDKSRANFVYHGKQPYRRDLVNEISSWLGIEPFELLMPPAEALAIRQLRDAAKTIAGSAVA